MQVTSVFSKTDPRYDFHQFQITHELCQRWCSELLWALRVSSYILWLTNTPTNFIILMNGDFKSFLYYFIIFINDILVYPKREEDHADHLDIFWVFLGNKCCMLDIPSVNWGWLPLHLLTCSLKEGVMVDFSKHWGPTKFCY